MNYKLISNDHNSMSPAPRLSEFQSGSKKISRAISINTKDRELDGVNPPTQTDDAPKNEYQKDKNESQESDQLSFSRSNTGESSLQRREFFINNIFCGYLMD
jgi:hypothetical protein